MQDDVGPVLSLVVGHGLDLSQGPATELLRDALVLEVEKIDGSEIVNEKDPPG
jgi:hypothetical protein